MKTLLNGNERIELGVGDDLYAEYCPGGSGQTPCLTILRPSAGWEAKVRNIRPNHLSNCTTSVTADFAFHRWEHGDGFCVAGYRRFALIGAESGQISIEQELEFTDKESLDILEILESIDGDNLLIVSTKVGWLLTDRPVTLKGIQIPGLAKAVYRNANGFEILYIDTSDVDLPEKKLVI